MPKPTPAQLEKMALLANKIRQDVIRIVSDAGSGHIAGPLDMADVFTALYFFVLNIDPKRPWWDERDRLILSNGHICPVWYATLAHRGYFPHKELNTLRRLNSRLQGHPHFRELPGVENTGGPLGQGLSQAIGAALAGRMDGKRWRVYALMSDAEHQEGQTMEAVMFAGNRKINNLTAIIDRNNIQIDGFTEDVMPLEPLAEKYRANSWHVIEADGHNIEAIIDACHEAESIFEKPTVIIAHTTPGKGVEFMEKKFEWHSKAFKPGEAREALKELRSLGGKIHGEHE
jgi:transketolase